MADTQLAELNQAVVDIKDTPSEKVEYNNSSGSLHAVVSLLQEIIGDKTVTVVDTLEEMQDLETPRTQLAVVRGEGAFVYYSGTIPAEPNVYPAAGGGYWGKQETITTPALSELEGVNLSSPAPAQRDLLYYDATAGKWKAGNLGALIQNRLGDANWPHSLVEYGITQDKILTLAANGLLRILNSSNVTFKTGAANSIALLMQAIPNLTVGSNNVIITDQNSLFASNPAKEVQGSVIIGNPGPLGALGEPTGILAIGVNGQRVFSRNEDGEIEISNADTPSQLTLNGSFVVTGNVACAGDLQATEISAQLISTPGADISSSGVTTAALGVTGLSALGVTNILGKFTSTGGGAEFRRDGVSTVFFSLNSATGATLIQSALQLNGVVTHSGPSFTITGDINTSSLGVYADNAAAVAAGLPVGRQYRTATGVLMVRY